MIKRHYILPLLLFCLLQLSCNNVQKSNNYSIVPKKNIDSTEILLNKYFSKIDIPYFLKEEIDSIIVNEEKIKNDKNYRNQFKRKARGRKSSIRKLGGQSQIPAPFRRYLLPSELTSFNKDSLSDFIILFELYKKRQDKIRSISNYSLTHDEIQKLIQGSYKDSIYYKELSASRFKKDSVESTTRFNITKDSLQSIVHPVDSILPFGPRQLGEYIKQKISYVHFELSETSNLTQEQNIKQEQLKSIDAFYQSLLPDEELFENDGYYGRKLPPIKTYQNIYDYRISPDYTADNVDKFDITNSNFTLRLSDINKYEVYFVTSFKFEHLLLYDRKLQHCIVLNAHQGLKAYSYEDYQPFFYVDNNSVSVFSKSNAKGVYELYYTHKIEFNDNGDVTIIQQCVPVNFEAKGYSKERLEERKENLRGNLIETKRKRDSFFDKIKPIIPNYPFGPKQLNAHNFPKGIFTKNTYNDSLRIHINTLDSIFPYYRKVAILYQVDINKLPNKVFRLLRAYTLPTTNKIKKIELSPIEIWRQSYFCNLTNDWDCSNIYGSDIKDVIDFRLPNIKNYEVYLSTDTYLKGMLTLYNPITQTANVINVLDITDSYFRVFYINEYGQIEIYQGLTNRNSKDNEVYKVSKTHIIEVLSNGEIKINKIKE